MIAEFGIEDRSNLTRPSTKPCEALFQYARNRLSFQLELLTLEIVLLSIAVSTVVVAVPTRLVIGAANEGVPGPEVGAPELVPSTGC